ncbi:MAG: hypothetical protein MI920_02785 [Kiloniellales bacterium]|nr:hypothetical protein [Kiloniellales bacterium]
MSRTLAAIVVFVALCGAATAQGPQWIEEFTERPEEWGGDIHYAILDMPNRQALQVGCVRNRIEKVLVVFPQDRGVPAPLAPEPQVRYAFDNEDLQTTDWPLFEVGSIQVPRGGESSRITRRIATASRLVVQATTPDGTWVTADFDLAGNERVIPKMLEACGIPLT